MQLNQRAFDLVEQMLADADRLRIAVHRMPGEATLVDCGINVLGGLEAGLRLAQVCMAGLGHAAIDSGHSEVWPGPWVSVRSDHPVLACLASQYAGWELKREKFFAMGSGPMRTSRASEPLFESLGYRETALLAVGVLETRQLPAPELCREVAAACGIRPADLTLLIAPTASIAGTVQVVARSVETCLHKLHELGGELSQIVAAWGRAPLPTIAADDLAAIGRTNDAILYGGEVMLWVRGDDKVWSDLGLQIPSSSSRDYGRTFAELFAQYDNDFYRIDPLLFSPAVVTFVNLETGRSQSYGNTARDLLSHSFGL